MKKFPWIRIFVIMTIVIFIWFNSHHLYNSKNQPRHKDRPTTYAHFSKIDHINYFLFPRLLLTHPLVVELCPNQGLFIPKNWWHWVKTTTPTAAINFWYEDNRKSSPYILNTDQRIDWSLIDNETITIWNSNKNTDVGRSQLGKFRHSGTPNAYTITLNNFDVGARNQNIKHILESHIRPPAEITAPYDFNLWISSGTHDTGLHYDDEDGILCVLYGKKTVTLYPPTDSSNLYPFPVHSFKWFNNTALNFRYNTCQNLGEIQGKPSSHLLYETCKNNCQVLTAIDKFFNIYGENGLIWGFKKHGSLYRWEVYRYTLNQNPSIRSWDINSQLAIKNPGHFYYNSQNPKQVGLPFWGYGTEVKNREEILESQIFVVDASTRFRKKYQEYMTKLNYKTIADEFKGIILEKYSPYELCIFNKTPGQIFVMYFGLEINEFIDFLRVHNYPPSLLLHVEKHRSSYRINNEVAIVYDIITKKPIRSAFYGIL